MRQRGNVTSLLGNILLALTELQLQCLLAAQEKFRRLQHCQLIHRLFRAEWGANAVRGDIGANTRSAELAPCGKRKKFIIDIDKLGCAPNGIRR